MATLRLFAAAREAAGTDRTVIDAGTIREVLAEAERRFGAPFSKVLAASRVWCNGEPAEPDHLVTASDEVAVLPPVSGG